MPTVETTVHGAPSVKHQPRWSARWQMSLSTLLIGGTAFLAGPMLWPMSPSVPAPPSTLLPGYIAISAIEALAFGFAASFAAWAWPAVRELRLGTPWLNRALFGSLVWLMGNWWIHDNLHMHVGLDMNRLIFIELFFHMTLLACGLALAVGLLRIAWDADARRQPDRSVHSLPAQLPTQK